MARCQVAPPSVDASTAATVPPVSDAVPCAVTSEPLATVLPGAGAVMVETGGSVAGRAAGDSPFGVAPGWTPMAVNRFMVAWRMSVLAGDRTPSWLLARPQAHWTVPAPNTSAPLEAR